MRKSLLCHTQTPLIDLSLSLFHSISGNTPEAASPDQLIAEGKRCLAAGDANGAVECLQEACSLL